MKDLLHLIAHILGRTAVDISGDVLKLVTMAFGLGHDAGRASLHLVGGSDVGPGDPVIDLPPIMRYIDAKQKIQAIKELRRQTDCSLLEGKKFIEALIGIFPDGWGDRTHWSERGD